MRGFKSLKFWQKSHDLALKVYSTSDNFPTKEKFGLTSQLRRAALSIPTNIAEGSGRKSEKEFAHFLSIAMGSTTETEYLLTFSKDYGILDHKELEKLLSLIEEIKSMLFVLINKLKA